MVTYAERPWLQSYDIGMPTALDVPDIPLHQLLKNTRARSPHQPALITPANLPILGRISKSVTYEELDRASDALAAALLELGLKKSDRVAIVMPNSVAFVISFYAILKAGGVVAATNPTYPAEKMAHQINDCDAEIVLCMTLFYGLVKEIQPRTKVNTVIAANIKEYLPPLAKLLFTIAREKKDGHFVEQLAEDDHWFQDLLAKYDGKQPAVTVSADDLAIFQYTGGTTGLAKAAMSRHRALVANMLMTEGILDLLDLPPEDEISLGAIPFFHVYGLVIVVSTSVYRGSKIVLVPNPRDIDDVLGNIETFRTTLFPGVPALYNAINNHPRVQSGDVDLSSLSLCISGSAPLPESTKAEFERLSGATLREGFGMSEAPTATHVNPIFRENRPASIGLPLPEMDMRIVSLDDDEADVPVGEIGELLMAGPNVMVGYHGMLEETQKALRERDGKRWLYTGDIARMDEDGYFYIVDRKKDMALIGGFNVYPTNVENAIAAHESVLEVGVAAIPHPERAGQEALKAWIVRKPGAQLTAEQVIEFLGDKLAPYEIPRRIAFIDELPKTAVGKTLRRELTQLEAEAD
ncbi:MAG: AMP-binding protein [Chloroflexi bacterium]|nr:AMP-binding protein [Chloroflexota bacterium]MCY3581159.1 AMP-binding protein [Chloroflexota bacterium]MCY3717222.1 AMP-binding protein [Chloroflexota bacterium]MDE2651416.1 AMP-binding protein [Chloroflexota bacterium]MYA94230.1 long-chain fatty acid--CoA ligase [Chloroflexota bacterium]